MIGAMTDVTTPTPGRLLKGTEGDVVSPGVLPGCQAVVLACIDVRFVEPLRSFLGSLGLAGDYDLVCWPGGALALTTPDRPVVLAGETALTRGAQVAVFTAVGVPPEHRARDGLDGIDEPGSVADDATLGRVRPILDRLEVSCRARVGAYAVRGGRWGRGRRIARAIQRGANEKAVALIVIGHTRGRRPARAGHLLRHSARDILVVPVPSPPSPARDCNPPTLVPTTPRSIP